MYKRSGKLTLTAMAGYKYVYANGYSQGDAFYDAGREKIYIEPGFMWRFGKNMNCKTNFRYSYITDQQDAFSEKEPAYNVFNLTVGLVSGF